MTNSNRKSKIPFAAIFFALALPAMAFVRYLQYSTVIGVDTGFFQHDGGFLTVAYYAFFGAFAAVLLVLTLCDKKRKCGILPHKSAGIVGGLKIGFASALTGAALTAACGFLAAVQVLEFLPPNKPNILRLLAMFAAVLGYAFISYTVFIKRRLTPVCGLALLLIAAYHISEGAAEFMLRIYTVNLSARLVVLAVYILSSLFYLTCGRVVLKSEGWFTAIFATLYGYCLALLALSDAAARIYYYHSADETLQSALNANADTNGFQSPSGLFILNAVAILWVIAALSAKKQKLYGEHELRDEDDEQAEEPIADSVDETGANGVTEVSEVNKVPPVTEVPPANEED